MRSECGKEKGVMSSFLLWLMSRLWSRGRRRWEKQLDWAANMVWTGLLYLYFFRKLKSKYKD